MGRSLGLGVLLGLALASPPERARACSTLPPPTAWVGYPAHGSEGVPTDVVLFYDSLRANIGDVTQASFRLTAESGKAISLDAWQTYGWTFELTPAKQLEPRTTYALTSLSPGLGPLIFTTGDGPVEASPAPPQASLTHYRLTGTPSGDCDTLASRSCVGVAVGLPVVTRQITDAGSVDEVAYLHAESWFTDLTGESGYDCVRLQSRAPNGFLSHSVDLCRDDDVELEVVELDGEERIACTASGLTEGGRVVEPDGCSFSAKTAGPGHAVLSALLAWSLVQRRRSCGRRGCR